MPSKATSAFKAGPNLRHGCFKIPKLNILNSVQFFPTTSKRTNNEIRKQYQLVTDTQLNEEGKLDPYHHLKDWVKILKERKQNQTDWWW